MKAVNKVLISYTKLYYVKFKWANQSCSPSKISQSIMHGALVIEMVNNSFSETRKTLVAWESVESSNRKNWDIGSGKYISIKFR